MPAFVIHYDLCKGTRREYQELYDALEKAQAVRATESTWFLSSSWDAIRIRAWLMRYLDAKDVIAVNVLAVGNGFATGNIPPAAVTWMNQHLKARKVGVKK